ncbi:MAG: hypothetical protein ABSD08_18740 [Xanthobacteraceae bacterium]|jgi:hypothetical protein
MTTFAVATPHALVLVLTVSHGSLFCQPPYLRRRGCRRFTFTECQSILTH